jgi:hypothetical protein|tara:strand:- start:97 stop:597 length:501 start_codon:yes stop_codon:yes gene_type:complete
MATYKDYSPSKFNDFMSPKCLFEDIKEYIPKDKVISMPFYGDGMIGKYMKEMGFDVIHQQEDFFEFNRGEVVVDNPPFEFKKEIIAELIKRDKPFMLIMPVSTICYQYSKMLKNHLQIIIPKKRPKFIYYDKATNKLDKDWKKKSATFDSVWVCWKMDLPQDIIFL